MIFLFDWLSFHFLLFFPSSASHCFIINNFVKKINDYKPEWNFKMVKSRPNALFKRKIIKEGKRCEIASSLFYYSFFWCFFVCPNKKETKKSKQKKRETTKEERGCKCLYIYVFFLSFYLVCLNILLWINNIVNLYYFVYYYY